MTKLTHAIVVKVGETRYLFRRCPYTESDARATAERLKQQNLNADYEAIAVADLPDDLKARYEALNKNW